MIESLTSAERTGWEHRGYVVRESVLTTAEIDELRAACEQLCAQLAAASRESHKVDVSAYYVFETDESLNVMIKWEPGSRDVIQGVEPLVHLHPVLERYALHEALTAPSRELLDVDEVGLFTEKLNVKRAGVGGAYALHRDLPYWLGDADDVERMVTVLLTLDDASAENGALEVLPGSHLMDDLPYKESELEFERNELDPARLDTSVMVPVEIPAGSAVFFGPRLIHRSGANQSGEHRRALLYTYQRAGLRDQREINRAWFEAMRNR
jgi:ectoine hydroxylase-related dioxygenase (phytanoyl-CoA dioxygenase family)